MTHYLATADDRDHAAASQDRAIETARHRHDATERPTYPSTIERIANLARDIEMIDASLASPWMTCSREAAYQQKRRGVLAEALDGETKWMRGLTVVAVLDKREAA